MSAVDRSTARPGRARTLREDLLDDLRQAAPMPVTPPPPPVPGPVVPADRTADRSNPGGTGPAFELRVTPRLRWGLQTTTLGEGPAFVLRAGPVQISVTGFRR